MDGTRSCGRSDARLLVLFDADCGFCLYGRDVLLRWDRRGQLRADVIQRHERTTLADLSADERLATWHAIHPDGRRESRAAALAAVLERLPGGRAGAWAIRAFPDPADRVYRWVAAHRTGISRLLRTQGHPERGGW
jgi:predicted DCC family thiol-disulfide oxidoreductase YuxK